ncbi:Acriflavin resistance plasma membrane protein (plasmid) [Mycetohabitans rhizoxinica HKI 454]|uniref:Acriflavin resistance plasma membrane protein n=3 Tax=Mycetohabitans TaxID=2571159 RepID=E5AVM8_MYCRK|nr:efflux RND transporter permease subunit [Mycetohabitans rhizoxinica]MCG1048246.1 efflux RND transporter permease subunit [Mycetohabitans sp. B6]CBW77152.1 Acriflavin resistance plasma membrane protein [Mycetohabitans rhizoxinica HKI 454]
MNISKFFIDRPIFAGVLSVLVLLAGVIALFQLPIFEYPEAVPPSVIVYAQYPGANPKVIAETVASPLEEQINGVENMLYMQSQANSDGNMATTVTFKLGTDPDKAQQLVQNRVSQALPRLPEDVQRLGVTTVKSSPTLTMVVHLISPNDRYDMTYLRNYALINVKDRLERIQGVGQVQLWGSGDYSMRVWLNPQKVAQRGMAASDVINAIREQNVQVAAGVVGASPSLPGAPLQLSVNAQGRLQTEEQFGDIVLKTSPDGGVTHLRDVARVELGASEYGLRALLDNKPAVAIAINQSPGANSLAISEQVRRTMAELKADMPPGVEYRIVYDPTQFVRASINAVVHTLLEAIALVVIVVIVFLQTWRASIIPLIAVPVSIVGTVVPDAGLMEDVLMPVADVDRDNRPLSGRNGYVMHFTRNPLPVSAGGWTLVAEPLDDDGTGGDARRPGWRNRHVVLTNRDHLVRNRDGSIDITVQPTAPARPATANWLVSPTGRFRMVMRIYGPNTMMHRLNWRPPVLDRQ